MDERKVFLRPSLLFFSGILLLLFPSLALAIIDEELLQPISVDFQDIDVRIALPYLGSLAGLVIALDPTVFSGSGGTIEPSLTIREKNLSLLFLLRKIASQKGLDFLITDSFIFFSTEERLASFPWHNPWDREKRIKVDLTRADLRYSLPQIGISMGIVVAVDPIPFKGSGGYKNPFFTMKSPEVTLEELVRQVAREKGLDYLMGERFLWLGEPKSLFMRLDKGGGGVRDSQGNQMDIPYGALSGPAYLRMTRVASFPKASSLPGLMLSQRGVDLLPSGLTFSMPITVTLTYEDKDIKGLDEQSLKVFYYDDQGATYRRLGISRESIDALGNRISFETDHFTLFVMAGNVSEKMTKEREKEALPQ